MPYQGHLYIVTEALGPDLYNAVVRKKRQLKAKDLQTIVRDLVKCLSFLHRFGIVHLDLKPENILVKNELTMNVKVIDFGSASFIEGGDYDYLQTRPYRAPEVTFGCKYTFTADMWSLGCILYELVTGTVLFPYRTVQENYAKALALHNSLDFRLFSDGPKFRKYIGQNGLLQIGDVKEQSRPLSKVVIPKEGVNFSAELAQVCPNADLVDFILRCLVLDPAKRLMVGQAVEHPFVKQTIK